MVINREFFFRGWLPAGLVVNARLISSAPRGVSPTLIPVLNPVPGSFWDVSQPKPVFPVTQATDNVAVLLVDPIPETTLVLLPLRRWLGDGTPYVLASNTWYEGRVREVSGDDVMAVRITFTQPLVNFYSAFQGIDAKDIVATQYPGRIIKGARTAARCFIDKGDATIHELGYFPKVQEGENTYKLVPIDVVENYAYRFAGMRMGFEELAPLSAVATIQCEVAEGRSPHFESMKYVSIVPAVSQDTQLMYGLRDNEITEMLAGYSISKIGACGAVSWCDSGDRILHYN